MSVHLTRQDQKHLIRKDLEKNPQNQKAKDQKPRKEKRMLKGEGSNFFVLMFVIIFHNSTKLIHLNENYNK